MSFHTICTACEFKLAGPIVDIQLDFDDHVRRDHRLGFLGFLLGDYRDPRARAIKRLSKERGERCGYVFPFDEPIVAPAQDEGEVGDFAFVNLLKD